MFSFKGGVHPYEGKELTENKSIINLDADDIMVFPMVQHIGAPAVPIVKRGDKVLVGQTIGDAGGFISAKVISSVSGKVKAVEPRIVSGGQKVDCIVVENDKLFEKIEGYGEKRDYKNLTNDEIRQIVKDAGIVGMGGACFPTNVKLMPGDDDAITDIIVNAAECEPYLTCDYRSMLEETEDFLGGVDVFLQLFKNAKVHISIENNKAEAIRYIKDKTSENPRINVCTLKTKYPQGGERMLIKAILNKTIESRILPKDVGCIVSNVATVIAIFNAVAKNIPLHSRVITVSGDAIKNPGNFRVQNGTSTKSLLTAVGGFSKDVFRLISGGPMMGTALYTVDVPTTKGLSGLLGLSKKAAHDYESSNCIRCAKCVSVCPEFLTPVFMMEDVQTKKFDIFEKIHHGMECIECGSCSYICPARRKLTQNFKLGKQSVLKQRAKEKKNG